MVSVRLFVLFLVTCVITAQEEEDPEWWKTALIYQIYPRSFKDTNGDGIGDLPGITEKLDYLKDLGVDAIWISPIFKSPMVDFGYDVSNYREIDPMFGTMDDFDELHARAKELDIKVILDLVPNHTSSESEWFQLSLNRTEPYTDYYIWNDGICSEDGVCEPPNNWLSSFSGSAWTWREERKQFYFHQFAEAQPDLNYRNPNVVEEIKNVIRFWLDKDINGFRVDAVPALFEDEALQDEPVGNPDADPETHDYLSHIYTINLNETYDMIQQWRQVFEEYRNSSEGVRVMIVEAWGTDEEVFAYYGTAEKPGANFPFNFKLINNIYTNVTAQVLYDTVSAWMDNMNDFRWPNWVLGNHDNHRIGSRIEDRLLDGMNLLAQLLPGTAITYMGEEIAMLDNSHITYEETEDIAGILAGPDNYTQVSRDPERTPFQWDSSYGVGFSTTNETWLPISDTYEWLNVEAQLSPITSHYYVYRNISTLRHLDVLKKGNYSYTMTDDGAFFLLRRQYKDDDVIFAFNFIEEELTPYVQDVFENVDEYMYVYTTSTHTMYRVGTYIHSNWVVMIAKGSIVISNIPPSRCTLCNDTSTDTTETSADETITTTTTTTTTEPAIVPEWWLKKYLSFF